MTAIDDYSMLPEEYRSRIEALEMFIGDVDGAYTDDGTIDAEDAVCALNGIIARLAAHT